MRNSGEVCDRHFKINNENDKYNIRIHRTGNDLRLCGINIL